MKDFLELIKQTNKFSVKLFVFCCFLSAFFLLSGLSLNFFIKDLPFSMFELNAFAQMLIISAPVVIFEGAMVAILCDIVKNDGKSK